MNLLLVLRSSLRLEFASFFTVCIAPVYISPPSVIPVRDSTVPIFVCLSTKSDYINNYLSIILCYILVSRLTR